ncbi:MAG TPA: patatin-like phospholipase family protein [Anaerolineales bacterium]|jgi:predicted acylesterase/phospholipase RssA
MEYDLVFEGGGAKGVSFVGALEVFERHGHTPRRLIGSSAGALTACLIAAGYKSKENMEALTERSPNGKTRFESFMCTPTIYEDYIVKDQLGYWLRSELNNPLIPDLIEPAVDKLIVSLIKGELVRHLVSLLMWGGWFSGDEVICWLREKLDAGGRNLGDTNFEQFAQKTGRDLSVVASDITGKEMLVLNHRTTPNLPVVWAVRMSMSVPFVWQEVIWKEEWGTYLGCTLTGHRIVDGGLLSNFPISLFVQNDENVNEIMGKGTQSQNVIGLLIDESIAVPGAGPLPNSSSGGPVFLERIDLLETMILRIQGLADTVLSARDNSMVSSYERLICHLPAKDIGTLEFCMAPERMQAVKQAGAAAMESFLAGSTDPGSISNGV